MSRGEWGLADIKGVKREFIDINRIQKILRGIAGIKSTLWILAILRGVYGVMGPLHICTCNIKYFILVRFGYADQPTTATKWSHCDETVVHMVHFTIECQFCQNLHRGHLCPQVNIL